MSTEKLTYGNVEMPGYIDHQAEMADKPEGFGWDNLGLRDILFVAVHRMWGTLNGTLSYFSQSNVGALTDFGIGVEATDGKALAGVIHKYNNPLGYRSGWASGRVSAPYGDGLAIVNKYGVNAVNRFGVSLEISGYEDTPIDAKAWGEIVQFVAYWADFKRIPYTSFPINPATGISFVIWHQEFTIGTGKKCPFQLVMSRTNELIADVKEVLRKAQTADTGTETPAEPKPPVETPVYATRKPIDALALLADADFKGRRAVVTDEGTDYTLVYDRVVATKKTPRLQMAKAGAKRVGPDIKAGEEFDVTWLFTAKDKRRYYLTDYWTRVLESDTKLVADAA